MVNARRQRYACPIAGIELSSWAGRLRDPAQYVLPSAAPILRPASPAHSLSNLAAAKKAPTPWPRPRRPRAHERLQDQFPVLASSGRPPGAGVSGSGGHSGSAPAARAVGRVRRSPLGSPGFPPLMPLAGSPHPISLQSGGGRQTLLWLGVCASNPREPRAVGESTRPGAILNQKRAYLSYATRCSVD